MRILAIAVLLASLAPLPAAAQKWVRIAAGEKTRTYIDLDSVKRDKLIRADTLTVLVTPLPDNPVQSFVATIDYDCANRSGRFALMIAYGPDRGELRRKEYTDPEDFRPPTAGSDAEKVYNFVCSATPDKGVPVADPWSDTP